MPLILYCCLLNFPLNVAVFVNSDNYWPELSKRRGLSDSSYYHSSHYFHSTPDSHFLRSSTKYLIILIPYLPHTPTVLYMYVKKERKKKPPITTKFPASIFKNSLSVGRSGLLHFASGYFILSNILCLASDIFDQRITLIFHEFILSSTLQSLVVCSQMR